MSETRFRRDAVLSLPGILVPGVSSFVAFALIANFSGASMLGLVSLGWVTTNFASAAVALGPAHAALHYSREPDDAPGTTSDFRMLVLQRSFVVAGMLLAAGIVLTLLGTEIGPVLLISAPWSLGQSLILFDSEMLRMEGRFGHLSGISSVRAVIGWSTAIAASAAGGGLAVIVLPTTVVGIVVGVLMGHGQFTSPGPEVRHTVRTVGRPVSRSSVLSYGVAYADRYIIQFILGPASVGVYTLAYQLGEGAMELVTTPLNAALLPRVVRNWSSTDRERHTQAVAALRSSLVVIAGMCIVVPIGALVFGALGIFGIVDDAPEFGALTAIIALAVGAQAVTRVAYAVLLARGRTDRSFNAFLAAGILSLAVVPLMTWEWGLIGAAWASFITYAALAMLTVRSARR